MPSYPPSVIACVRDWALSQPDKVAVIAEDGSATYQELWEGALAFCAILTDKGVMARDAVLLQASHTAAYVKAYLGVTLHGAIAVPFELGAPDSTVLELAQRVGSNVVGICGAHAGLEGLSQIDLSVACSGGGDCLSGTVELPGSHDLAEYLFTTGTTGRSKTVMLSHLAVMSVEMNILEATRMEHDNVSLVPMPLNHVFALRRMQAALVRGATTVLLPGVASLKKVFHAIEENHVTSLSLVPSALAYIHQTTKGYLGKYADRIRFVESSSAPLPEVTRAWLRETLPQSRLYNSYGCTESTACCMIEYSHRDDDATCVGTPCVTAKIVILDPNGTEPVEGRGRVAIGGSAVMNGYLNDPDATGASLRGGMVLTNDLGYFEDGELHILGRLDDVVLVGGNNVSPVEVEDEQAKCASVADCACVGASGGVGGCQLTMFVVPSTGIDPGEAVASARDYLKAHVEAYKVPEVYRIVPEIPKTYNGKVDRKVLRTMLEQA